MKNKNKYITQPKSSAMTSRGCIKSQNALGSGHPEFISGSDLQCVEILKQVQDDGIRDFCDSLVSQAKRRTWGESTNKKPI